MIMNYEELGFQRIAFDPMNPNKLKYNVKQSDTKSRGFYVQVIQANQVIPPSAGDILTFFAKKPDNTEVFVTAEIRNGEYVIALPNQIFSIPGSIETEITLQGGNLESITLKGPTINVLSTFSRDAIESVDDFTALSQALSQVASILGEVEDIQLYAENLSLVIGNMTELSTGDKTSVVKAINELETRIGEVLSSTELDNLLINKVDNTTLGLMTGLLTEHQETIVGAMNELKTDLEEVRLSTSAEELIGIFTSKADKTMVGDLTLLGTEAKANVVDAINEVVQAMTGLYQGLDAQSVEVMIGAKVGDITLLPTTNKTNLVSAIIELNSAITEIKSVTDVATLTALISGKANKSDLTALTAVVADKVNSEDFYAKTVILEGLISDKVSNITFNEAMAGVQAGTDEAAVNTLIQNVSGDLTTLTTTENLNLVGAINEVNAELIDKVSNITLTEAIAAIPTGEENASSVSGENMVDITTGQQQQINASYNSSILARTFDYVYEVQIGEEWIAAETLVEGDYFMEMEYIDDMDYPNLTAMYSPSLNQLINVMSGGGPGDEYQVPARQVTVYRYLSGQINASTVSTIGENGEASQINSSHYATINSIRSQINASGGADISGSNSQINASTTVEITGGSSQINSSYDSSVTGYRSQLNTSKYSKVSGSNAEIHASSAVENKEEFTTAFGYGPLYAPLSSNRRITLASKTGNIVATGTLKTGQAFTDYAELFPNITGVAQEPGLIQTVDDVGTLGYGVRPANEGEDIVGVISAMAGVILGDTPFAWQGRWLKDEWGAHVMEDVEVETGELDEEGNPIMETVNLPKENPDFDPTLDFQPRQDRPADWSVVGMVGQVYVRVKEDVAVLDYVKPWINGVGQTSVEQTGLKVMKITKAYDAEKGYAIAFCLLK